MTTKNRSLVRLLVRLHVVACLSAGLLTPALAQFLQTGAGPFDYNTTTNWTGGTINGVFSQTPAASQTVTFATNTSLSTGLTFNLGGSAKALTLRGTGTNVALTLGGDISVSGTTSAITLGAASPDMLDVNLGGADRTFTVDAGNTLTFSNAITGSNTVTKAGNGTLNYSGATSYTGATIINAGTLSLNTSGAIASGNDITLYSTAASTTAKLSLASNVAQTIGTLAFGGAGQTSTSAGNVTLNSGSTLTLGGTVSYNATNNPSVASSIGGSGTLALGGNRTFNIADSTASFNEFTISAPISGSGQSLTKTGAGRLTLTAASGTTYDGGTIVSGGEFFLSASNTLVTTAPVTVKGTTSGVAASFWLGTNINQTIGALTFGGSGASSNSTNNVSLGTNSVLTLGGTVTYDATNNPLGANINTVGRLALGGDRTFNIADSTATSTELTISVAVSGSGQSLTKTGAGTLRLSGANTYDGGTIVHAGTILLNASNTLASTGGVTVKDTAGGTAYLSLGANFTQTIGTLTFGGAGQTATSAGNVTLNAGSTLTLGGTVTYDATNNPSVASSIGGSGTLALGGNRTFNIADSTANINEFTIYAPISGSGQSLIKTGAGRLTLQGANTYDGGTIVNGGQFFLSANNTLVATAPVTINGTTAGTTTNLVLGSNITQTIGALTFGGSGATATSSNVFTVNPGATLTLGGTVTYDATSNPTVTAAFGGSGILALGGNRTFDIANSTGTSSEFSVPITISGLSQSITKTGAGTLSLSGANTYTGGTIVSAGGLAVRNSTGSGVGTGAVTIQSGAHLRGTGFVGGLTTIQAGAALGTGGTGATPGNLTFTNGLTLNDNAVFNFTLGTTSDKFTLTGGTLTGASTLGSLTINLTAGTGFGAGVYTLFDFSTGGVTTSSFDVGDFAFGTTVSGYTYGLAMAGNTLQLTATASAIPEPSTYAAIFGAVSLVGAVAWRRRARRG